MKNFIKIMFVLSLLFIVCLPFSFVGCDAKIEQTLFMVSVNQNSHGTISVDKQNVKEGDNVAITVQPDNGYSLYVLLCDGKVIDTNTITMPNHNIIISAIFKQTEEDVVLKKGNYINISDVRVDWAYNETIDTMIFNTVTIKDNNMADITFTVNADVLYELNDLIYLQDDRTLSINVPGMEVVAHIVDNETFVVYRENNWITTYKYYEDCEIEAGTQLGNNDFLTFKDNSRLDLKYQDENGEVLIGNCEYVIKGNTIIIHHENCAYYIRLGQYSDFLDIKGAFVFDSTLPTSCRIVNIYKNV